MYRALKNIGFKGAEKSEHPSVNLSKYYLAKIGGEWFFGKFSRQWYGLNFHSGWGSSGHQFNAPGYNSSRWEELHELVLTKPIEDKYYDD